MTPEEYDRALFEQAKHNVFTTGDGDAVASFAVAREIIRLARENWTPPDPISPRVRAAREYLKTQGIDAPGVDAGKYDDDTTIPAFLAGFAAAVELADELVIVGELVAKGDYKPSALLHRIATYRQSIGDE